MSGPPYMTNFDHHIDDDLEDYLRAGNESEHTAWDFHGEVRYDATTGEFVEEVYRYHCHVGTVRASSLRGLMEEVNDRHGWR